MTAAVVVVLRPPEKWARSAFGLQMSQYDRRGAGRAGRAGPRRAAMQPRPEAAAPLGRCPSSTRQRARGRDGVAALRRDGPGLLVLDVGGLGETARVERGGIPGRAGDTDRDHGAAVSWSRSATWSTASMISTCWGPSPGCTSQLAFGETAVEASLHTATQTLDVWGYRGALNYRHGCAADSDRRC